MEISLKKQVCNREYAYDNASNSVALLPPDPIYHIRNPWATEDSGKGKYAHNNSYIRLGTSMVQNIQREEEEGANI